MRPGSMADYFGVEWPWSTRIYSAIVVAWAALVAYAWRASRAPQFVPDAVEPEVAAAR